MTQEQIVEEIKREVRELVISISCRAYWYGEETGDYDMKRFREDEPEYFKELDSLLTTTAQRVREERIEEVIQKARADECNAWLDGRRCYECGNEKEVTPLSDTCRQCWETA